MLPNFFVSGLSAKFVFFVSLGLLLSLGVAAQGSAGDSSLPQDRKLYKQRLKEFGPCSRTSSTQLPALVAASRCMTLEVSENPANPEGRKIPLKTMVVPALTAEPLLDPIVILAGGPGQAATEMAVMARVFNAARQNREILLIDQRGTGELSPLQCDIEPDESAAFSLAATLEYQRKNLPLCLEQMEADPEFYTTDVFVQDLEKIRGYLGYSQFNLWGGSYGTRAALAFLKAYPESTRSVIIDGVAPTAIALPTFIERDASLALEKVFEDCSKQKACASAYPDLREHFDAVVADLSEPKKINFMDGIDATLQEVEINRDMFIALLRFTLYGRENQRLTPYIIEQAYEGNFTPFAAIVPPSGGINQYLMSSVLCNEDYRLIQNGLVDEENTKMYKINSPLFTETIKQGCELWPKRELPSSYFEPVESDKPVLIFSGALDPVTPKTWGDLVAETLSNSRHYVIDGFAHNTMSSPCAIGILNDFVKVADVNSLDAECLKKLKRRPFFVTAGGSARTLDQRAQPETSQ